MFLDDWLKPNRVNYSLNHLTKIFKEELVNNIL